MAFDRLHGWLRGLPEEADIRREVSALCAAHGIDEDAVSRELCMSWDELKPFAADPLVTIGAHTVSHCNLAKQTEAMVVHELSASRTDIENVLQRPAVHLAYPYGDRCAAGYTEFALAKSAGFETAVTTRPGVIASDNFSQLSSAAAGLAERQLSGHPLSAGADLRRGHRDVERLPARRRRIVWPRCRRTAALLESWVPRRIRPAFAADRHPAENTRPTSDRPSTDAR